MSYADEFSEADFASLHYEMDAERLRMVKTKVHDHDKSRYPQELLEALNAHGKATGLVKSVLWVFGPMFLFMGIIIGLAFWLPGTPLSDWLTKFVAFCLGVIPGYAAFKHFKLVYAFILIIAMTLFSIMVLLPSLGAAQLVLPEYPV